MLFHSYKSILIGALLFCSLPALAQVNIFTETFPNEFAGEEQTALANWDFLYGNVDVGRYMRGTYPGTGIDLAGSVNSSIETKNTFTLPPGNYTLSFLAQDNTFGNSQMLVEIGSAFNQVYHAGGTPQTYTSNFVVSSATNAKIRLTEQGPEDKGGTFIANISLDYTAPLPVSLLNFSARQAEEQVMLEWQTASETNNMGFEIQQSADGAAWKAIHFIPGKNTTSALSSYTYAADHIVSGGSYFRLKQLDNNGDYSYSRIVYLNVKDTDNITVFQNTSTHQLEVIGVPDPELSLFDVNGIQLKHLSHAQTMNIEDLPNGFYLLAINQQSNTPKVIRFVKH